MSNGPKVSAAKYRILNIISLGSRIKIYLIKNTNSFKRFFPQLKIFKMQLKNLKLNVIYLSPHCLIYSVPRFCRHLIGASCFQLCFQQEEFVMLVISVNVTAKILCSGIEILWWQISNWTKCNQNLELIYKNVHYLCKTFRFIC